MKDIPRSTKILYAAAAIVFLGAAYYYLIFNKDSGAAVESNGVAASSAEISFISLIGQIDPISFDVSVLSDPKFTQLQDIRIAVIPEPSGRKDPFLPYSGAPVAPVAK